MPQPVHVPPDPIGGHLTALYDRVARVERRPIAGAPTLFGSITPSGVAGPYGIFPADDLIAGDSFPMPTGTGIAVVGEFTYQAGNFLGMVVAGFPLGTAAIPVLGSTATMTMRKVRDDLGAVVNGPLASATFTGTIPLDGTDVPYTSFTTTSDVSQGTGGRSTQFHVNNDGTYYVEFSIAP